jgi:hypothetical protein
MPQVTIELPDQLAEQLNTYLQTHPEDTIVGLIHEALKIKLLPKDSSKLLELAGIRNVQLKGNPHPPAPSPKAGEREPNRIAPLLLWERGWGEGGSEQSHIA